MKKAIIIIITIGLIIGAYFIFSKKKNSKKAPAPKVKSAIVEKGRILVKLEETGEIQPIKEIQIKSEISGKVLKFFVDEGSHVEKGDVIAEIQSDYDQTKTISSVKSSLKLAEIRLKNAEDDFADKQILFEQKFVSKNELDKAADTVEEAKISYQSALQQYESIQDIDTNSEIAKIISTASGTVIARLVQEGEKVVSSAGSYSDGTVIVKLADLSQMIVKSKINEVDISKITKEQQVEIQV
ncbi:MAG: efflux RND transporter periplasmic adaptor subunit, partial [Candidatus Cloacimonetes bacterium]|nr:efflux RND transporter periplasmic adaptor subunit [Candidatus Cloacimonadota bacterium]